MSLPQVIINIKNGGLGGVVALADGVAGLIVSGDANPSGAWALGSAKQFFSITEVKDAGLDPTYDTDNTTNAYKQVSDFYAVAGDGAELWVMVVPKTETMEDICDAASVNAYAKALLVSAGGTIRLLGVTRVPDAAYEATVVAGIDDDVIAAITKLESLADSQAAAMEPFVGVVEGRDWQGSTGDIEDLKGLGFNRVCGVACGDKTDKSAGVGLFLGRLAADPVMRKPGRVKSGAIPITAGYTSDGEAITRGIVDALDTKGWIVMTTYPQRSGFYWGIDNTCSSADDDFSTITNRRVIDKAMLIAYNTYVTEIQDEITIDPDTGKIDPGVVKYFEGKISNAINNLMTAAGEISGMSAFIDPAQNILSTGNLVIRLNIVPVGYTRTITVNLGFTNPATA
jgi:hypothetical protein